MTYSQHSCLSEGTGVCPRNQPGKPTTKRCPRCGGTWHVVSGVYGVFVHSSHNGGDARYRAVDAVRTGGRAVCERVMATDPRYVVRFIVSVAGRH